jgi:hypothetical protein
MSCGVPPLGGGITQFSSNPVMNFNGLLFALKLISNIYIPLLAWGHSFVFPAEIQQGEFQLNRLLVI